MAAAATPESKIERALRTVKIAMTLFLGTHSVTSGENGFNLDVASLEPICAVLASSAREVNLAGIVSSPSQGPVIIEKYTSTLQRQYRPGVGYELHLPVAITMGILAVEVACDMTRADDATLTGFIKDSFRDLGLVVTPLAAAPAPLPCTVCGAPTFQRCEKCAKMGIDTPYCSVECQRKHWPVHKSMHPAVAKQRTRRTRKGNRRRTRKRTVYRLESM